LIPLKDDIPTRRLPIVTIALIAINVIVYFVFEHGLWSLGDFGTQRVVEYGAIPLEFTHSGTECVAVTANQIQCSPGIGSGDAPVWLTAISSMFLHGSLFHLGGNMLFLWIFGNNIEDSMGHARFVVFYLACGIAAALAQVILNPASPIPMVGASGAISGVMGAYLILYPRVRVFTMVPIGIFPISIALPAWTMLLYWAGLQLLSGVIGMMGAQDEGGVAFGAHVGGFLSGLMLQRPLLMWRYRGA